MRQYLCLAMIAASAVVLAAPAAQAAPAVHVLTVGKAGGTAVRPGAVLKARLAAGTKATFKLSGKGVTCTRAASSATVSANPNAPGTARASLTALTFARCSAPGFTQTSLTVKNLPYPVTVSDSKGDPVTVSGRARTRPLSVTAKLKSATTSLTCTYTAASITGHFSDATSSVTFTGQKLTKSAGKGCLAKVYFTATFGPVVDSSVKGSPKVFVN
jgi:hypothetical protein